MKPKKHESTNTISGTANLSFAIFCRASGEFTYSNSGIDEQDVFELETALNRALSLGGGVESAIQSEVVGQAESAVRGDSARQRGLNAILNLGGVHLLHTHLSGLSARRTAPLNILVVAAALNNLCPDLEVHARFTLQPAMQNAANAFLEAVGERLKEVSLNRFGVLAELATIFATYDEWPTRTAEMTIRISTDSWCTMPASSSDD